MNYLLLMCFFSTIVLGQTGVGINTTNPQQALHLGGSTGTVRVEGLNSTNNIYNGGGFDKTVPLYVDQNGDFTLQVAPFQNSDGSDAWSTSTPLITTSLTIPAPASSPNNGVRNVVILPYTITLTKPAVLEIKYNISFEVLRNAVPTKLKSVRARRVSNFYTVDAPVLLATTRRYGQASKCYYNNNGPVADPVNAAQGNMYNSSTTYINLTAGTHTIRFYGEASTGSTNDITLVNFAVGNDSVFMRIH
jgi:hypothetical protein